MDASATSSAAGQQAQLANGTPTPYAGARRLDVAMERSISSSTQGREASDAEQAELGSGLAAGLHLGAAHGAAASDLSWPATHSQPQAFFVHVQSGWSEVSRCPRRQQPSEPELTAHPEQAVEAQAERARQAVAELVRRRALAGARAAAGLE